MLLKPAKLDPHEPALDDAASSTKTLAKDKSICMENELLPGVLAMCTENTTYPGTGYRYDCSLDKAKKALSIPDFVRTNLNVIKEYMME